MFWFSKKKKIYLGIDIGTSAVKLVELENDNGRYNLKNYGIYPLGAYLKDLEVQKFANEEIADIIKDIIDKAGIEAKNSFFSIPVYSSFSTLIDFPEMSKKEIASAIQFEAKKYIPVPMNEVILDWAIINPLSKQSGLQVLLVAVLKEVVNNYSQIAKLAKLHLSSLEVETFSLTRALLGNDKSGVVLIDIGARSSNISIVDAGNIRVIHNLEMGGLKLTSSVAEKKSFTQIEAERFKLDLLKKQDSAADDMVNPFLDSIINRVKKIISNYQDKYNRKLDKCILVGGSAQIFGIINYFSKNLNIEVSFGNPFARIVCPPELKPALPKLAPGLAVAIGIAMR